RLERCRVLGNSSLSSGGGFANDTSGLLTLVSSLVSGNSAANRGGGIYDESDSRSFVMSSTLASNTAGGAGGAIFAGGGEDVVTNSILWANLAADLGGESGQLDIGDAQASFTVHHSCVEGWTGQLGGEGNIGDDPLFIDIRGIDEVAGTTDDDLRLGPSSPCIDAGDTSALPPDVADLDGDDDRGEPTPFDLARRPRVRGVEVDMGAHEAD
ncbi:MAG TPA: hypothetical protein VK116_00590, partial [Planctomycetota bacterium]|nr:hypothetical protein [Planctomycetota bacterium]